jgi:RNA polymerase sigma-70 factor (ECF subfamily)
MGTQPDDELARVLYVTAVTERGSVATPPSGREGRGGGHTATTTFDDFYRATSRRVLHHVYALTGDRTEAQDCVQEAYARAWQRWSRVASHDDPEAWVRTVARRIAVSRWRRARTAMGYLLHHGRPETISAPSEDHALLVRALRDLSQQQRDAVVLHHLVGLSVEEVAQRTGSPVGTVKARLHRGRAALADVIGDLDAPPADTAPPTDTAPPVVRPSDATQPLTRPSGTGPPPRTDEQDPPSHSSPSHDSPSHDSPTSRGRAADEEHHDGH